MKTLTVMLLMAVALLAGGQTNLTPEQLEARRALNQENTRKLLEKMQQVTDAAMAAQAQAAAQRALHPPISGFGSNENFSAPLMRPRKPDFYNTNVMIPIQMIPTIERHGRPGDWTNFLPSQFFDPTTNAEYLHTREMLRQSKPLPGYIQSDDTNFLAKVKAWEDEEREKFRQQEAKKPS